MAGRNISYKIETKAINNLVSYNDSKAPATEAYRSLRTNLNYYNIDKSIKSIVVTSPSSSDGKTTTVCNLSVSMAQTGKKVLIVDADLRRPRVHTHFDLSNDVGLTDILMNEKLIDKAIKQVEEINNLSVLTSGWKTQNPAEVLSSQNVKSVINMLKSIYDIVLIDTPPVAQLTDAAVIAAEVDGVILVLASGEDNYNSARYAKQALKKVEANVLGVVLTKIRHPVSRYY